MAEINLVPSNRLRMFAGLARWALRLLALGWLAVALFWGGLHFLIVPRIGELRPWVQAQASKVLGVVVRIGAIEARSNGLIPSVEMREVEILDAQGRTALRLPSVLAALSPRSALHMGFEQLYVEGAQLDVRRASDGRIFIAGFPLPSQPSDDGAAADWVFSQTELVVRHGLVRWTDELRGAPALELSDVDVVLRNRLFTHSLRLDANPPAAWGKRFTLMGRFTEPLLGGRAGDWAQWTGQLYARAPQIDLAPWRPYVDWGGDLRQGMGALQAWVDVDHARITQATADVALQSVQVQLASDLQVLDLLQVSGRLGARMLQGGYEYSTEQLAFDTADGLHWPGGNLRLSLWEQPSRHGELVADQLDLAAMAEIVQRLPVDAPVRQTLERLRPQGRVEQIQAGWSGPPDAPTQFSAKGRVKALEWAALTHASGAGATIGTTVPGLRGADLDFDLNQSNGRATVTMRAGAVDMPGVLEQAQIAVQELQADVQWRKEGALWSVDISQARFANADAAGEARIKWRSQEGPEPLPGVLDLQGSLSRAEASAVPRYMPQALPADVRTYLQQALLGGTASQVKYRVKGDLAKFPFSDARQGEFHVSAQVQNATYAYAPAVVLPRDSRPWPVLSQIQAEFSMDQDVLRVAAARGTVAGLQFSRADARITDLYGKPRVEVSTEARGPASAGLALVNASPVGQWTDDFLARATVSGAADYRLRLSLPLDALERSTVQGAVVLGGNDVFLMPAIPRVSRARGTLNFTETGFSLSGMQGRALGGDFKADGGLQFASLASNPASLPAAKEGPQGSVVRGSALPATAVAPTVLRLQGVATAEGLRQARELGAVAQLGEFASGSTPYTATVGLRGNAPEILVNSSLVGMAIQLPAPLAKTAETPMPLRFETAVVRGSLLPGMRLQDLLQLEVGRLLQASYVRDISGAQARVLRGSVAVGLGGDEAAPTPMDAVAANINLGQVDGDAWQAVLARMGWGNSGSGTATGTAGNTPWDLAYVPQQVALRVRELTVSGNKVANLLVGASREGMLWRANVDAPEVSGYLEYRQSGSSAPGRLHARLARLVLAQSAASNVEDLLDQQPSAIPALDVVVDDFELRGKKLGKLEVQAVNQAAQSANQREWRLNRLNLSTPEATLTATGNWVAVNQQASSSATAARSLRDRRRTVLNFKLDISDAGQLLTRFGTPGVVAKGKGRAEGQISWMGSPTTPDYPSMGGGFNINVETGQFLKADPGIAKLLGVLSLQSLPRRLTLDFRDVFSDGFAFDFFRGDVTIEQGIARTNNLQMKGVNAAVLMEGSADIARETQNVKVVVIPEINAGSASLIASAINPLMGLTSFLAQVILRRPLIDANTQEFLVDGTWADPRVTQVERK